ncbi:MAG: hypothetical protein KAR55_03360 [Thermoplasmatales archaeon]|nr:hypothetical protein [Thermoplasmatales archaeon]
MISCLNHVKIVTKLISILSKDKPEIRDKCKEISNEILNVKKILMKSNSNGICDMLYPLFQFAIFFTMGVPYGQAIGYFILYILAPIGFMLDCFWFHWYP